MFLSNCAVCGGKNQPFLVKNFQIISLKLLTGDKFMPELHLKQPGFT